MSRTSASFVVGVILLMLVAGLVGYYGGGRDQAAEPEAPPSLLMQMSTGEYQDRLREILEKQAPPVPDDPEAPPFREQVRQHLALAARAVEADISRLSHWKMYERCRAEHQADGFDERGAHRQCVDYYNRALSEPFDAMLGSAISQQDLQAFRRARFYQQEVLAEVNRILLESPNVVERLVALKLLELSDQAYSGTPLDTEIYTHLERYSHPELSLILDPRVEVPVDLPEVAEGLVRYAGEARVWVESANRAGVLLGRSQHKERLVGVVDTVLAEGWRDNTQSVPKGVAVGLGACAAACAPAFAKLATAATTEDVTTLLFVALFSVRDADQRQALLRDVEALLPPVDSLPPGQREQREQIFAALKR